MKKLLQRMFAHERLSYQEAKQTLVEIAEGKYNQSQVASFLTVFQMRSIAIEELRGFRDALLDLCLKIDLSDFNTIDLCGTGGDGKDTFNISTLSSFIVAGAGVKVAKHGNYGVSSSCGSSNVLEHLGYEFTNDPDKLKRQIDQAGICFLHAPLFHPAMKNVAPIRRELQLKTFFNMLGPMVNPSFPQNQLVGVFSLELARLYSYMYQQTDKNYNIIHALDGYDEISLTGDFKVISNHSEEIRTPDYFGFERITQESIYGGKDVPEAAEIFTNILSGKSTEAQRNVVFANASMAISCATSLSLEDSLVKAQDSLNSGAALESFKKLIAA
ncbi:MAG: anthranilate phosphoribosyltransferase [Flavobacteriales bacterium]|nr:anthranilate phosphoribosyltransferase [Flavobacteriales bacterium]